MKREGAANNGTKEKCYQKSVQTAKVRGGDLLSIFSVDLIVNERSGRYHGCKGL
jgi:hypothetical protein